MPSNPILPGFNPDPSICRVGNDYFLATSSFEYFPGVPLYHSKDLINWTLIGHALNRKSQLDMRTVDPGAGVWAPTLRYWKGRFYLATCVVWWRARKPIQPRGFYVSTDNIFDDKSWSDPIYFDMIGIDQDLFFDDDDRAYLCVSRFSTGPRQPAGSKLITYACEIDLATGNSISPTVPLRVSTVKSSVAEGPHIYKWGGYHYLVTADGGTGPRHQVWIMRSVNGPLGPYEEAPDRLKVNPLVHNGADPVIQRTGHADFVQGPDGKWWCVMLGVRQQEATALAQLGRETFLAPVKWDEGGWPVVNNGKVIGPTVEGDLPERLKSDMSWQDDFTSDQLELGWYTLRTPIKPAHSLSARKNHLTLISNGIRIDQLENPAMVLRKQLSYTGTWSTRLDFTPTNEYEEGGTVVYYSDASYAAVVVKLVGDHRVVLARWTDHQTRDVKEVSRDIPSTGPIDLFIQAEPTQYTLLYKLAGTPSQPTSTSTSTSTAEAEIQTLVTVSSLTLDGGSPAEYEFYFTGAHFGLFNQAVDGENCLCPAYFEWARYDDGEVAYPSLAVNGAGLAGLAGRVNEQANGHADGVANGQANGHANGHNGHNGHNGYVNGHANGHANGQAATTILA